jgi:hypothetical protein
MVETSDRSAPLAPTPHQVWARVVLWVVLVAIVVGAGVYVLRSCLKAPADVIDRTGKAIGQAGNALVTVVSAFNRGTVTTSFLSYASSVSPSHYLQFATLKQTEIFTRTDEASTGFGHIPLPDVVVEARAPVEYTYYLDLNARWQLLLKDNVLHVLAPEIKFNKPAVDASQIKYEVRRGSLFRNTEAAQENLKRSISSLAERRAVENLSLVRETGRRQTAEFVEKWLAKSFTDGKSYPVKVYFPDETPPPGAPIEKAPLK